MNYKDLIDAIRILDTAESEVWKEERTGPAFAFLLHAKRHVEAQATAALRGE